MSKSPGLIQNSGDQMATAMLDHGADIRFVQEMLGHKRIETTLIYTHVSIEKPKKVHRTTHPAELAWREERKTIIAWTPVTPAEVTVLRQKLSPDTKTFARVLNISERTARQMESGAKPVKGPLMRLLQLLRRDPQVADALLLTIPAIDHVTDRPGIFQSQLCGP